MQAISVVELAKLVSTCCNSAAKADGDSVEISRTVDVLKQLEKREVTSQALKETDAGKKINKLTKHSSTDIANAAAKVVAAWKSAIAAQKERQASLSGRGYESDKSTSGTPSSHTHVKSEVKPPQFQGKIVPTGDQVRDKCRQMLAEALAAAQDEVEGDPGAVACAVETAMHKQNLGDKKKYAARYRTLSFNLKDVNNAELRANVLSGVITPEHLVDMNPEDLAPKSKREEYDKIRDKMKRECERGQTSQASTDQFQCSKCRQRKCTYYQMQTRSADEPMTTFVTCQVCNNRWKFC